MNEKYQDIIHLPHPEPKNRQRMSQYQRAAQFAPFAALTGHGAAIDETARLTDQKAELSESEAALLNMKISLLKDRSWEHPEVSVTFFEKDVFKDGGHYATHTGAVKRMNDYDATLSFEDGTIVPIGDIMDLRGDLFDGIPM